MEHQDWEVVRFHKKRPTDAKSKAAAVTQAQRQGTAETVQKDHGRAERDHFRKLEAHDGEAPNKSALRRLNLSMRKLLTDARTAAGLTRDQLAQRMNVPRKTVEDLETGQVMQDGDILNKIRRVLGVSLKFDT